MGVRSAVPARRPPCAARRGAAPPPPIRNARELASRSSARSRAVPSAARRAAAAPLLARARASARARRARPRGRSSAAPPSRGLAPATPRAPPRAACAAARPPHASNDGHSQSERTMATVPCSVGGRACACSTACASASTACDDGRGARMVSEEVGPEDGRGARMVSERGGGPRGGAARSPVWYRLGTRARELVVHSELLRVQHGVGLLRCAQLGRFACHTRTPRAAATPSAWPAPHASSERRTLAPRCRGGCFGRSARCAPATLQHVLPPRCSTCSRHAAARAPATLQHVLPPRCSTCSRHAAARAPACIAAAVRDSRYAPANAASSSSNLASSSRSRVA
jgi:hypothetical protein